MVRKNRTEKSFYEDIKPIDEVLEKENIISGPFKVAFIGNGDKYQIGSIILLKGKYLPFANDSIFPEGHKLEDLKEKRTEFSIIE